MWEGRSGMEPTEHDDVRLLSVLRDVEPGARSAVSVPRAIRSGARRHRVRQAIGAAVVAGLTALGVGVLPTVLDRRDAEPATPVGEFGVSRQEFTVGSAGGFTPVSYETGRYRQRVRLVPAPDAEGVPPGATVTLYAAGWLPGGQAAGAQAPDVDGHRAVWLDEPDGAGLAWEWSTDAWAVVHVDAT